MIDNGQQLEKAAKEQGALSRPLYRDKRTASPNIMTEKRPIYPIHPGQVLADELAEIQMTAAEQTGDEIKRTIDRWYPRQQEQATIALH
jgi:hypothetical protein